MIHMFLLPIMFLYGSEKVVDLVINSKNIGTDWRGYKTEDCVKGIEIFGENKF